MKKIRIGLMAFVMIIGMAFGGVKVDAASNQPTIAVQEQKPVVIYSGTQNTLTFHLSNESVHVAKNMKVIPDVSVTNLDGFRLMNTSFSLSNTSVWAQEPIEITVEAVVDDAVAEGVYPINLLISYENSTRDYIEREILTYFEVRNDDAKKENVVIKETNASLLAPLKGEDITFAYKVFNGENYTAGNVKTWIDGLANNYFSFTSTSSTKTIGSLGKKIQKDVSFTYLISEDTPDGSYPYTIYLEYENEEGNRVVRTQTYNLFISGGIAGKGQISVANVRYPSSSRQDSAFTLGFDLINTGDKPVEDLVIRMNTNSIFIPKSASVVKVEELGIGETYTFEAELVATGEDLTDRNYPVEFTYDYSDGEEMISDTQIMGIYVDAIESDGNSGGNSPKIIISKIVSEPQIVKAGSEFDLQLDFMNTNKSKAIYNVKAYITANETTQETGNVFVPVDSSNTFYIDDIGPKDVESRSIKLFTVPDAAPKTYTLTLNFEYEDKDGNAYTATELVGIPVTQVTKLESSGFNIPPEVVVGEGLNIYFDLFNKGKAKVYNLYVEAEGNFNSDPMSKYIGNLDVGSSDYFDAYVNFYEPGPVEGVFHITYEDASGELFSIDKNFSVNVIEMTMPEWGEEDFMPDPYEPIEPENSNMKWMIGGLMTFLLIVIVLVVIGRRRKKKKEALIFDEDE